MEKALARVVQSRNFTRADRFESSVLGRHGRNIHDMKEGVMQLGMVGLGPMGGNMVRRLMRGGHECVVQDVSVAAVLALTEGRRDRIVIARGFRKQTAEAPRHLPHAACGARGFDHRHTRSAP